MKKAQIRKNEPAYLRHKILMYGFWYYYVKPKYGEKVKLCYIDTGSFIVYIKTEGIAENVKTRFNLQIMN